VYSSQLGAGSLLLIAEGYITGKAYEYLASGRPILAITGGEDLIELIDRSHAGVCLSPDDPDKIADALIQQFNSRDQAFDIDTDFLKQYDRRRITGELAKLFNDIIARESNN
ncbi:hypothetical protein KAU08_07585, partial [bacterium]|nr:hypothetical protein [bacterium]